VCRGKSSSPDAAGGLGACAGASLLHHAVTWSTSTPTPSASPGSIPGRTVTGSVRRPGNAASRWEAPTGWRPATGSDEVNVACARIALHTFHVPRVVARLHDPRRERSTGSTGSRPSPPVTWGIHRMADLLLYSHLDHGDLPRERGGGHRGNGGSPAARRKDRPELRVPGRPASSRSTREGRTFLRPTGPCSARRIACISPCSEPPRIASGRSRPRVKVIHSLPVAHRGAKGDHGGKTRYRRGLETVRNLDEENAARLEEALKGIAPTCTVTSSSSPSGHPFSAGPAGRHAGDRHPLGAVGDGTAQPQFASTSTPP